MKFYQRIAEYYDKIFPLNPKQVEFVLNESTGKRLLDIGCATGELAIRLGDYYENVVGLDLDPSLVRRAKARLPKSHISIVELSMLDLTKHFEENSFDTVTCFGNTLAHLNSDIQVLDFFEQVRYVLKPGGKLLLQIINFDRVIDQNASDLPLISNDSIEFHRKYVYHPISDRIVFRSQLHIVGTGEVISNQIPLLPIRKVAINYMLKTAGFSTIKCFGSFQSTPFALDCSIPLIIRVS